MNVAMPFERRNEYTWEACMTIGDYWQYSIKDKKFKSAKELVGILVDVVSRGGNLLLNVGPAPDGTIPAPLMVPGEANGKNPQVTYSTWPFTAMSAGFWQPLPRSTG